MKSPFRATPTFGASRARTNSPGRTALEALLISLASLFLFSPMAHADVIHVHATFTLRQAAIFPEPGGVLVYETGWSAPFVLVQPHALDRVLVHISFADADGRPQYLVLRDLGRHYLDASGFQLLNAALALDTDTGTVRARYANGWVISQSLPTVLGNLVHGTATADLPFLDGNLYANLTDGSIAIHELQVEFNFNDPANPPVFEGATGFNRVSFSARADGLTVVEMPSVTLLSGPTRNDGSAFDLDQNGTPDFGLIGIALGESQHFRYRVAAFANLAATDDDFTLSDVLGGAFTLDPDAERAATGCNDGTCDGVATVNSCSAATVLANGNIVMDPTQRTPRRAYGTCLSNPRSPAPRKSKARRS